MKNGNILEMARGLNELEELNLPLNIKTSFIFARNIQILAPLVNVIQEKQMEIYKKYGNETERNTYKVPDEMIPTVEKELNELLNIEIDVDLVKLKLEDIGEIQIPLNVLKKIIYMIE